MASLAGLDCTGGGGAGAGATSSTSSSAAPSIASSNSLRRGVAEAEAAEIAAETSGFQDRMAEWKPQ